jgi:predicted ATPase
MPPSEGPVIISHSGIILIDEAENHLHPQLQQRIGFWLKTHFPNVQFIVTTHSPFICQAADALFRVGNGQIEPVTGETFRRVVNGSNEEAVLTELFGLSSAWSDVSEQKRVTLANLETSALDKGVLTPKMAAQMRELAAELPGELTAQVERVIQVVQGT